MFMHIETKLFCLNQLFYKHLLNSCHVQSAKPYVVNINVNIYICLSIKDDIVYAGTKYLSLNIKL